MKSPGPSWWCGLDSLHLMVSGLSAQTCSLGLASCVLFCCLCPDRQIYPSPISRQLPTGCFPQNSKPLRSSWAAAPTQATTTARIVIICAHDPQLPTVWASRIGLGKPLLSSQPQRHQETAAGGRAVQQTNTHQVDLRSNVSSSLPI